MAKDTSLAPAMTLQQAIARAEALVPEAHAQRARAIARQQMAPALHLIQDEQRLGEALLHGVLTAAEARLECSPVPSSFRPRLASYILSPSTC